MAVYTTQPTGGCYNVPTSGSYNDCRELLPDSITACDAGYYMATTSATSCTDVGSGYYSPAGATDRTVCPSGYSGSDGARSSESDCYKNCPTSGSDSDGTYTLAGGKVYYK